MKKIQKEEKKNSLVVDKSPRHYLRCFPDQVGIDCTARPASLPVSLWMPANVLAYLYNVESTPLSPPVGLHGCLV